MPGAIDATWITSQDIHRVRGIYNDLGPKMKALEARERKEKSPINQEMLDIGVGADQEVNVIHVQEINVMPTD
ncbi:unnamed protein product [Linum trigynum]|uniref:Uncharacterized protein n=1 Tax=Linum trigynum TaxID=586398 RepID=A0AAV2EQK9_9ROSI